MLDCSSLLNMVKKPKLKAKFSNKVNVNLGKPFKRTLASVLNAVKDNGELNRKGIIDTTNHSNHCVDRCLTYLIDNGCLNRSFVRMSGPYKVYSYKVKASP